MKGLGLARVGESRGGGEEREGVDASEEDAMDGRRKLVSMVGMVMLFLLLRFLVWSSGLLIDAGISFSSLRGVSCGRLREVSGCVMLRGMSRVLLCRMSCVLLHGMSCVLLRGVTCLLRGESCVASSCGELLRKGGREGTGGARYSLPLGRGNLDTLLLIGV